MHAIDIPDQYIMQRGEWSSDKTLKAIYRGTIEEYMQKFTNMTRLHFNNMQHEMQHEIEKAQKNPGLSNGADGSRTRVQKTIPCTSTSLAGCFGQARFPSE